MELLQTKSSKAKYWKHGNMKICKYNQKQWENLKEKNAFENEGLKLH